MPEYHKRGFRDICRLESGLFKTANPTLVIFHGIQLNGIEVQDIKAKIKSQERGFQTDALVPKRLFTYKNTKGGSSMDAVKIVQSTIANYLVGVFLHNGKHHVFADKLFQHFPLFLHSHHLGIQAQKGCDFRIVNPFGIALHILQRDGGEVTSFTAQFAKVFHNKLLTLVLCLQV